MQTASFYSRSRTRTYDLRVMSPTSCQLLYPASCAGMINHFLVFVKAFCIGFILNFGFI